MWVAKNRSAFLWGLKLPVQKCANGGVDIPMCIFLGRVTPRKSTKQRTKWVWVSTSFDTTRTCPLSDARLKSSIKYGQSVFDQLTPSRAAALLFVYHYLVTRWHVVRDAERRFVLNERRRYHSDAFLELIPQWRSGRRGAPDSGEISSELQLEMISKVRMPRINGVKNKGGDGGGKEVKRYVSRSVGNSPSRFESMVKVKGPEGHRENVSSHSMCSVSSEWVWETVKGTICRRWPVEWDGVGPLDFEHVLLLHFFLQLTQTFFNLFFN